jgi:hypothetical protein
MARPVGCTYLSQGDAYEIGCGMPNDGSLLHNGRAKVPFGEYPIGVFDHAESPTVAKHDNFEKSIYAGQLRNRLSR